MDSPKGVLSRKLMRKTYKQRIVEIHSYLSKPVEGLDPLYSECRKNVVKKVPLLAIFGATDNGVKLCTHIHGVYPYITIEDDPFFSDLEEKLPNALDDELNKAYSNLEKSTPQIEYVFKTEKIHGRRLYGYEATPKVFIRIYFYYPYVTKRASELLAEGKVLGRIFQPYDAHIPYILQFMVDYDLHGMDCISFQRFDRRESSEESALNCASDSALLKPDHFGRMPVSKADKVTKCHYELDVMGSCILKPEKSDTKCLNPGIDAMWVDERERRRQNNVENWSQISVPGSQARTYEGEIFPAEAGYREILEQIISSLESEEYASGAEPEETSPSSSLMATIPCSQNPNHSPASGLFAEVLMLSNEQREKNEWKEKDDLELLQLLDELNSQEMCDNDERMERDISFEKSEEEELLLLDDKGDKLRDSQEKGTDIHGDETDWQQSVAFTMNFEEDTGVATTDNILEAQEDLEHSKKSLSPEDTPSSDGMNSNNSLFLQVDGQFDSSSSSGSDDDYKSSKRKRSKRFKQDSAAKVCSVKISLEKSDSGPRTRNKDVALSSSSNSRKMQDNKLEPTPTPTKVITRSGLSRRTPSGTQMVDQSKPTTNLNENKAHSSSDSGGRQTVQTRSSMKRSYKGSVKAEANPKIVHRTRRFDLKKASFLISSDESDVTEIADTVKRKARKSEAASTVVKSGIKEADIKTERVRTHSKKTEPHISSTEGYSKLKYSDTVVDEIKNNKAANKDEGFGIASRTLRSTKKEKSEQVSKNSKSVLAVSKSIEEYVESTQNRKTCSSLNAKTNNNSLKLQKPFVRIKRLTNAEISVRMNKKSIEKHCSEVSKEVSESLYKKLEKNKIESVHVLDSVKDLYQDREDNDNLKSSEKNKSNQERILLSPAPEDYANEVKVITEDENTTSAQPDNGESNSDYCPASKSDFDEREKNHEVIIIEDSMEMAKSPSSECIESCESFKDTCNDVSGSGGYDEGKTKHISTIVLEKADRFHLNTVETTQRISNGNLSEPAGKKMNNIETQTILDRTDACTSTDDLVFNVSKTVEESALIISMRSVRTQTESVCNSYSDNSFRNSEDGGNGSSHLDRGAVDGLEDRDNESIGQNWVVQFFECSKSSNDEAMDCNTETVLTENSKSNEVIVISDDEVLDSTEEKNTLPSAITSFYEFETQLVTESFASQDSIEVSTNSETEQVSSSTGSKEPTADEPVILESSSIETKKDLMPKKNFNCEYEVVFNLPSWKSMKDWKESVNSSIVADKLTEALILDNTDVAFDVYDVLSSSDEEQIPNVTRYIGMGDSDCESDESVGCSAPSFCSITGTTPTRSSEPNHDASPSSLFESPRSILKVYTPVSSRSKRRVTWSDSGREGGNNKSPQPLETSKVIIDSPSLRKRALTKSSSESRDSPSSDKMESSELDCVTPSNPYGFKHNVSNMGAANSFKRYQYLIICSLEVFTSVRGDLMPDPSLDPLNALFVRIMKDVPESENQLNEFTYCFYVNPGVENTKISLDHETLALRRSYFNTEKEMLQEFLKFLMELDPDILLGYEIEKMSWGYLYYRGYQLGFNMSAELSRMLPNPVFKNKSDCAIPEWRQEVPGRIVLNLWRLLRHEIAVQSYTYENTAYHILHRRVYLFQYKFLNDLWNRMLTKARVTTYFIERAKGNIELLQKLDLINRTSELSRLFGIRFYEVLSRGTQFRVESMMLRVAKQQNYIAVSPTIKQRAGMKSPEFVPLILEPISGLHSDPVAVLDFQSLYPTMMIAYNYDYTTCLGRVEHLGSNDEFPFGCLHHVVPPAVLKSLKDHIHISPCGVAFVDKSVKMGILPQMMEQILETRLMVKRSMKKWKDEECVQKMLDSRQLGLKLIANVSYGYTSANFSGRMPSVEIADSILSKGRETLQRAIDLVNCNKEKWKAEVIYGDTDSLFVKFPGQSREKAFELAKDIVDQVTMSNPKPVKLKLEKIFQPCILQSKKRYVGYAYETADQMEPKYDAKGIETVRRDGCPAVRKILEKTLHILFKSNDEANVKKYVEGQFRKLFDGHVSMSDYTFAREYRGRSGYKPGACVPSLEIAKKLSAKDPRAEPLSSERVPYVIVYDKPTLPLIKLVRTPMEFASNSSLRLNAHYYIEKVIIPALNRCLLLAKMDAFKWYLSLPRKYLRSMYTAVESKGTLDNFILHQNCLNCDRKTSEGICSVCKENSNVTIHSIFKKVDVMSKKLNAAKQICEICSSEVHKCTSIDCPVYHKLLKYEREEGIRNRYVDEIEKMMK